MKIFSYLKYFLFISRHWNPWLGLFTIRYEMSGERKYGINSIDVDDLKNLSVRGKNKKNASIYQGTNYYILEKAFAYLSEMDVDTDSAIVDFGAGKGRIMAVAAFHGFRNIKGIEFAPALCAAAEKNLAVISPRFPGTKMTVLCSDATDYWVLPEDGVFFFFNPFDERVMLAVVKNILRSLKDGPRQITIVYINPLYKDIFESAGFTEVYYLLKMEYLELSILTYSAS